jgi:colicin import membrane protein
MIHRLTDMRRKPGMPVSVGLHAAVLVASIVTFSSPKKFEDATESIAVEVVSESALAEMMKGERDAKKQPTPTPRVDRVADRKEQNAPGAAARQVNAAETPKAQEATAREEQKETTAAVTVPPPIPLPPPRQQPPKPAEAAKPVEPPPKPAEPPKAAAKPPLPADTSEDDEEAEEAIRQAAKKREEQRKLEEARRAEEARKRDEMRKAEEAKRQEERRLEEARKVEQARRQEVQKQEEQRREQEEARRVEEARKRDEMRKLIEAKAAEQKKAEEAKAAELKKAEEAKKAQEAARKAAEDRRRREAEQEARNQATADAARRALLASREAPQNSGNTGAQVSRTASLGTPTATGQRLNPSDRAALAGLLSDQIRACWSIPVSGKPSSLPQVRVALNADGSLSGAPLLINASGDPNFRALAESGMRAIRQCAPFRIPQRYAATYDDWRQLAVQLNPDD